MSFMGVDIGQTGCKVLAFDVGGRLIADAYREYPVISPRPGWAELDSRLVVALCKAAIAEVAARARQTEPVTAIAVASQGESFTVVGADDEFLCNGMITSDTRARTQVAELTAAIGLERLYQITGHSPHTMFTLFKLAWLRDNRPAIFDQAAHILCYEDLLGFELTGEAVTDYSIAARTMMFDIRELAWSAEILDRIRERNKQGLSMKSMDCRTGPQSDWPLITRAVREFGSWREALNATGIESLRRVVVGKRFPDAQSVLEEIRQRHRKRLTLKSRDMPYASGDSGLFRAARRFFGPWSKAVAAAGIIYESVTDDPR